MVQAIQCKIKGLKCDAEGCGYEDHDTRYEDYEKYVNAPCPKCGANLLTEADLAATKAIIAGADWLNQMVGDVPEGGKQINVRMDMDGSGIPRPRIMDKAE
jgi:hypothetical protein